MTMAAARRTTAATIEQVRGRWVRPPGRFDMCDEPPHIDQARGTRHLAAGCCFMATHLRSARDAAAGGRSSVASELEAIFAPLPRIAPAAEPIVPTRRPSRSGLKLWLTLLGAMALAALVGSLAFLMPAVGPVQPRIAAKAETGLARLTPTRDTIIPAPRPATPPPTAQPQSARPQVDVRPDAPITRVRAPKRAAVPSAHRGRCPRFATTAWCLHGSIMAADDRLRDAYQAAVRAGVDRHTLIDVRSDWKRLRGRANRDPQALIRGYALLTQELRAETGRAWR